MRRYLSEFLSLLFVSLIPVALSGCVFIPAGSRLGNTHIDRKTDIEREKIEYLDMGLKSNPDKSAAIEITARRERRLRHTEKGTEEIFHHRVIIGFYPVAGANPYGTADPNVDSGGAIILTTVFGAIVMPFNLLFAWIPDFEEKSQSLLYYSWLGYSKTYIARVYHVDRQRVETERTDFYPDGIRVCALYRGLVLEEALTEHGVANFNKEHWKLPPGEDSIVVFKADVPEQILPVMVLFKSGVQIK